MIPGKNHQQKHHPPMIPIPIISQGHRRGPLCAPHRGPHGARLRGAEGGWRRGGLGPSQLWGRQRHGEKHGAFGRFWAVFGGKPGEFREFQEEQCRLVTGKVWTIHGGRMEKVWNKL